MAFAEIELARIEKVVGGFCKRRSPAHIWDKLHLEYSVHRHDVLIYEVRPHWRDPAQRMETPVAKLRYVRTADEWRLFWMRQNLKWYAYEPFPSARNLVELVEVVDEDAYAAFFG